MEDWKVSLESIVNPIYLKILGEFQAALYSGSWCMSQRTALADMEHFEHFWPRDLIDMKSKSSDGSSDGSIVLQDVQEPSGGTATMSPDSAFHIMANAFSSSSPTTANGWKQNLLLEQHGQDTFSTSLEDASPPATEIKYHDFSVDQQGLSFETGSDNCSPTPYGYSSISSSQSFLESLLDRNSPSLYGFQPNFNNIDVVQSLPLVSTKQQIPGYFQLTDNTSLLNTTTSPSDDNISSFLPSVSYKAAQTCVNVTIKPNYQDFEDFGSMTKKSSGRVLLKRPRLETPSPFPTFKVRKEKLGDRITALQQLVSPFGKTDTASVLHEAIQYIKLLHDQVNILSVPYMDNGATKQFNQIHDNVKDVKGHKQDLRSLGLCLVPVSSMFPVATEMTPISWTPSFQGSFK
uniref:transcription factor bHLH112-like isoform X2 n=1 Tax=Erigeron canadensis TaxID=72917 RepID=UPI001CB93206|nr:transcription factor bHLH112-like isoform X2 [Erigeron canadensis]